MLEVAIQKQLPGFSLDVDFRAGEEVVAIFGPSGAGKSLTLQCIAGLLRPDAGRIAINGRAVFDLAAGIDLPARKRRIGYVFQSYALFPHLSVRENMAFGLHGLAAGEKEARVQKMLSMMRLQGLEDRRPAELSGGQRQRVALARALATEPQVLLLDEPFAALDSPIRSRLHEELLNLLSRQPVTTVLVTHNLSEAYALSRTMVVCDAGRVLQSGPREDVLRRPNSRKVARFVGTKNLFRGVVEDAGNGRVSLRAGKLLVRAPGGPYARGEAVDFCIRPEEVMLVRDERELGTAVVENRYPAVIQGEVALGASYTLLVKLAGDPLGTGRPYDLHVDLPANVYHRLGVDRVRQWTISLKREAIHIIGRATR